MCVSFKKITSETLYFAILWSKNGCFHATFSKTPIHPLMGRNQKFCSKVPGFSSKISRCFNGESASLGYLVRNPIL